MAKRKLGRRVYVITIQDATLRIAAYSVVFFFLASALFSSVSLSGPSHTSAVLDLLIYFAALFVHELIHGIAFSAFGGKVKYGVGMASFVLPYAYATAEDQPFSLSQMMIVGLAPFIILCTLSAAVAIIWPQVAQYAGVVFIGNFAGAVGDLWLMSRLAKFRGLTRVTAVDEKVAVAIYTNDQRAAAIAERLRKQNDKTSPANRFITRWIIASAVLFIVAMIAPIVLGAASFKGSFVLGPANFALLSIAATKNSAVFSINYLPALVGGFIFSAISGATAAMGRR